MRGLLAAVAFLTRLPVGRLITFDAADVAKAGGWFPVVGALIGAICCVPVVLFKGYLPDGLAGASIVLTSALVTGGLHFDGLADTADGFGGGRDREHTLKIMRDHAIGSYGGTALALLVVFQAMAYAALIGRPGWAQVLMVVPALGRWSILLLTATLPYARPSASVAADMGGRRLVWATLGMLGLLAAARLWRAGVAALAVVLITACFGRYCRGRLGGITGDTLGANAEISECVALTVFLWTPRL